MGSECLGVNVEVGGRGSVGPHLWVPGLVSRTLYHWFHPSATHPHSEFLISLDSLKPVFKKKKSNHGGRRDGLTVKSTGYSEFTSQQPHVGLQPSMMGSGALFRQAGVHAGRAPYTYNTFKKSNQAKTNLCKAMQQAAHGGTHPPVLVFCGQEDASCPT